MCCSIKDKAYPRRCQIHRNVLGKSKYHPLNYRVSTGARLMGRSGMTFYLQNVSNGLPLTAANTLAKVTITAAPNDE
jgi:hypothetical protein